MTVYFTNAGMPGVEAVNRAGGDLGIWESVTFGHTEPVVEEGDILIFGAWHGSYALLLRRLKCKKARLVTSSLSQMELSLGGIEMQWLEQDFNFLERGVLDYIFFGSKDAYEYYKVRSDKVKYFPYPIHFNPEPFDWSQKEDSVGMFMGGPRKNQLNSIAAVDIAWRKRKFDFVTNFNGWIPAEEYKNLMRTLKATLFVSHAESFGYAAIDALEAGTLPIVGPCVKKNLRLEPWLCVGNPDSALEISQKIVEVLDIDSDTYTMALEENRDRIHHTAEEQNTDLEELLKGLTNEK